MSNKAISQLTNQRTYQFTDRSIDRSVSPVGVWSISQSVSVEYECMIYW